MTEAVQFQTADWCFGAFALLLVALGFFRGLSGALGFLAGTAAAAAAAYFGWMGLLTRIANPWARGLAAFAVALVAFGIVRMAVKAIAGKLLDTPADRIFGVVLALACAAGLAWAASHDPVARKHSLIAREVHSHAGPR